MHNAELLGDFFLSFAFGDVEGTGAEQLHRSLGVIQLLARPRGQEEEWKQVITSKTSLSPTATDSVINGYYCH